MQFQLKFPEIFYGLCQLTFKIQMEKNKGLRIAYTFLKIDNRNTDNGHEFGKIWGIVRGREAWRAAVHGVTKSQTQLSD